uniref:Uncharacterized protein n=1 Tax=Euplotes crassus TaxID=5936 RepID=A0A7S3KGB2_EUPCR|mmetsp:Transcript_26075/g.25926  ORF Transcript_26075/g.25926 Transcript_26075/m.25926 type:complete len:140 (+) Transcript_26075:963-1382(+)
MINGPSVLRGVGSDDEDEDGEYEKECAKYIPEVKRFTQFFSDSDPEVLFNVLATFVIELATDYSFSKKEYSTTFTYVDDEEIVSMTVNILDAGDVLDCTSTLSCIEAIRNHGDVFKFRDLFKDMKEFFGGHANSPDPEE